MDDIGIVPLKRKMDNETLCRVGLGALGLGLMV